MVVKPASSVALSETVARATLRASGSCSTWSFHVVSLYGWSKTCECASMRPGRSVSVGRSIDSASAGGVMLAAGPAASIRWPRTTTTQPSWRASPSKTRAGLSTYVFPGWPFGAAAPPPRRPCAPTTADPATSTATRPTTTERAMERTLRGPDSILGRRGPLHPAKLAPLRGAPTPTPFRSLLVGGDPCTPPSSLHSVGPRHPRRSARTQPWRASLACARALRCDHWQAGRLELQVQRRQVGRLDRRPGGHRLPIGLQRGVDRRQLIGRRLDIGRLERIHQAAEAVTHGRQRIRRRASRGAPTAAAPTTPASRRRSHRTCRG